jgi:hypothetical protein
MKLVIWFGYPEGQQEVSICSPRFELGYQIIRMRFRIFRNILP